jgi:CrcB protein
MSRILFLIGTGGLIGSIARYLTASYFTKVFPSAFPYGTFIVNVVGCLIIGIVFGLSERFSWLTPEWRFFLATGICGGFTTFSSFAYENIKLIQEGNFLVFAAYSIASFALGLLAVFIGLTLTKIQLN